MNRRARWWDLVGPPVVGILAVGLAAIVIGVALGHLGLWRTTAEDRAGQDFGIFLSSVRHADEGRSLYTPSMRQTASGPATAPLNLNLPHTVLLVWPFARLDDRAALTAWTVVSLALLAGACTAGLRALSWRFRLLPTLLALGYLLSWAPAAALTLTAQISFFVMLPVTLAWLAARGGDLRACGIWLGVAAAMKPFLLVFAPYVVLRRQHAAAGWMLGTLAAAILLGLVAFGWEAYAEWARQLPRITWSAHYFNASYMGFLQRAIGRSAYAVVGRAPEWVLPAAVLLCAATALLSYRAVLTPRPEPARTDADWTVLLLASLLMSPLGWNYYLWIALWPAAAMLAGEAPWSRPSWRGLWLLPGLLGWLWWGRMTGWGQPSPAATLTSASLYFWALLSLWLWALLAVRANARVAAGSLRPV